MGAIHLTGRFREEVASIVSDLLERGEEEQRLPPPFSDLSVVISDGEPTDVFALVSKDRSDYNLPAFFRVYLACR